jgi:hypothetical protein
MATWSEGCGRSQCKGIKSDGERCAEQELPDLEFCFRHAPDQLISMAEHMSGKKRCAGVVSYIMEQEGTEDRVQRRCGNQALPKSEWCRHHISVRGDVQRWVADQVDDAAGRELVLLRDDLPDAVRERFNNALTPIGNPFEALLEVAAEMKAFKERIGARVATLHVEEWRYSGTRIGEQLRSEIVVYERSMERLATTLVRIARLNIEERMMRITERQAEIIETAMMEALADLNLPAAVQEQARDAIVRRLSVA